MPQAAVRIGRDEGCFICLADGKASRTHATVNVTSQKAAIEDRDSSNGTFVNRVRVTGGPKRLEDGDVIKVGDTELRFGVYSHDSLQ